MATLNSNVRTDTESVKDIFNTSIGDEALKLHINAAAEVVDEVSDADDSVTTQRLELIETYVAAHFASAQDRRVTSEEVGDARFDYQGPTETTQYWETATSLDPTGVLAGGSVQVGFEVIESR